MIFKRDEYPVYSNLNTSIIPALNIYLASSGDFKEEVNDLAVELKLHGHNVTRKWWLAYIDREEREGDFYRRADVNFICDANIAAIQRADVLIMVSPKLRRYNGATVEIGIALALNKTVICFGSLERSAMFAHLIWVDDKNTLFELLKQWYI